MYIKMLFISNENEVKACHYRFWAFVDRNWKHITA